jgi:putative membrane protein
MRSFVSHKQIIWLGVYLLVLLWSSIGPYDRFTWWLEAVPALIALPLLLLTRKNFPLTSLSYGLILLHCCVLFVGAHYTYAQVPLFDILAQWMDSRNNYDKLGHFAQGFVPAILAREILLRHEAVKPGAWCVFLVGCFALALSAFYELIEWWVASATGEGAEAFLGTQGYVWDTQSDMMMALIGAVIALWSLSRLHDGQLERLADRHRPL